jgi:hypothetical protein
VPLPLVIVLLLLGLVVSIAASPLFSGERKPVRRANGVGAERPGGVQSELGDTRD